LNNIFGKGSQQDTAENSLRLSTAYFKMLIKSKEKNFFDI
jgi:hypothetical protein